MPGRAPAPSPPSPEAPGPRLHPMWILLFAIMIAVWFWPLASTSLVDSVVDYSQFFAWLEEGKIDRAVLSDRAIIGHLASPQTVGEKTINSFRATLPKEDPLLLAKLREKGVELRVELSDRPLFVQILGSILPWVLILGFGLWLSGRAQRMMAGGGGLFSAFSRAPRKKFEPTEAAGVTFEDVAGLKAAKRDLQEIVEFLKSPERFHALGAKVPRGVLLVGPPGTGKTLLARAVAGESGVAFYPISASEFIEMFVGVGAARVRDLFQEAKKNAPAIVFIDEIDAVGRTRGFGLTGAHEEREQTLNQLLSEMDGFDRQDSVVVLAATNRPDVLDAALLRPGRFDRRVLVERPELPARRAILGVHARGKPLAESVDLDQVAKDTPGFSGADLANLINEAALFASRRGGKTIEAADFSAALDKIVLGDPTEAKLDPQERRRIAAHEAGHAIVSRYSAGEPVRRVSILPRGFTLGATQQAAPLTDRHLITEPELEAKLRVLMGGRAGEQEVLGNVSSGAENDLREATELAFRMVAHFGMSERLGPVYHEHRAEHGFLGQRVAGEGSTSDATVHAIEDEAQALLRRALEEARSVIREHRRELDRLIAELLEHETLEVEELSTLLDDPRLLERRAAMQRTRGLDVRPR